MIKPSPRGEFLIKIFMAKKKKTDPRVKVPKLKWQNKHKKTK